MPDGGASWKSEQCEGSRGSGVGAGRLCSPLVASARTGAVGADAGRGRLVPGSGAEQGARVAAGPGAQRLRAGADGRADQAPGVPELELHAFEARTAADLHVHVVEADCRCGPCDAEKRPPSITSPKRSPVAEMGAAQWLSTTWLSTSSRRPPAAPRIDRSAYS